VDGDQEVAEERGKDGQGRRHLVPLLGGHFDTARNDGEEGRG
jgi:hypothetical protein